MGIKEPQYFGIRNKTTGSWLFIGKRIFSTPCWEVAQAQFDTTFDASLPNRIDRSDFEIAPFIKEDPRWHLVKQTRSRCPDCYGTSSILTSDSLRFEGITFYICFPCKKVFQAGVGELAAGK